MQSSYIVFVVEYGSGCHAMSCEKGERRQKSSFTLGQDYDRSDHRMKN